MITEIAIRNIKGIEDKKFSLQLFPNKPHLLVAPNGFGKSSIAVAFDSMNSQRLTLEDKDHFRADTSKTPFLSIVSDRTTLTADPTHNTIRSDFDIQVITSGLVPKATRTFQGGASASLEVKTIELRRIPNKVTFNYQFTAAKKQFGNNGKVLPNITSLLLDSRIGPVLTSFDFAKLSGARASKKLAKVIDVINKQSGSAEELFSWIESNTLEDLRAIDPLRDLAMELRSSQFAKSETEAFLIAYQLGELFKADKKRFKAATDWLQYLSEKDAYADLIESLRSSEWQWPKLTKDKKANKLVVGFPKADQISNGQRDVLTLVLQMHKALIEGSKKPLILVIDEVFDYLDDANLVAFQYYVTTLIEEYKTRGQQIYPIILTHLDPGVFFHFCFNRHTLHVHYLKKRSSGKSENTLKLIRARDENGGLKDLLEKYWFHYHPEPEEADLDDWPSNLPEDWHQPKAFNAYVMDELERYLAGKNYDPLAVCFAIRHVTERKAYSCLVQPADKEQFLTAVHTTNSKIDFVAARGFEMPSYHYLLGLIYNNNLHWKDRRDYISPLLPKLEHPTIKQVIESAVRLDG